jgi:hypothetical protein
MAFNPDWVVLFFTRITGTIQGIQAYKFGVYDYEPVFISLCLVWFIYNETLSQL